MAGGREKDELQCNRAVGRMDVRLAGGDPDHHPRSQVYDSIAVVTLPSPPVMIIYWSELWVCRAETVPGS